MGQARGGRQGESHLFEEVNARQVIVMQGEMCCLTRGQEAIKKAMDDFGSLRAHLTQVATQTRWIRACKSSPKQKRGTAL
jgi:hypothetical protein